MAQKKITQSITKIDCTNKRLGRVATQIAYILMGKNDPKYAPEKDSKNIVIATNVDKLEFIGNKLDSKTYFRHTGYPGGIREESLGDLFKRRPNEVLRRAVLGMLPKNRLQARRIRRLRFK